jgi:hypothetical protein
MCSWRMSSTGEASRRSPTAAASRTRGPPPAAAPAPSAAGTDARAEQAALYALPLVIMDLTREQFFADPIAADATPNRFLP